MHHNNHINSGGGGGREQSLLSHRSTRRNSPQSNIVGLVPNGLINFPEWLSEVFQQIFHRSVSVIHQDVQPTLLLFYFLEQFGYLVIFAMVTRNCDGFSSTCVDLERLLLRVWEWQTFFSGIVTCQTSLLVAHLSLTPSPSRNKGSWTLFDALNTDDAEPKDDSDSTDFCFASLFGSCILHLLQAFRVDNFSCY